MNVQFFKSFYNTFILLKVLKNLKTAIILLLRIIIFLKKKFYYG